MYTGVEYINEKPDKPYIVITDDGRCYIKMLKSDGRLYICECGSSKCRIYVPVVDESGRVHYVEYQGY